TTDRRSLPVGDHGHPDGELAQRRVVAGGGHRSGPVPEREALQGRLRPTDRIGRRSRTDGEAAQAAASVHAATHEGPRRRGPAGAAATAYPRRSRRPAPPTL